MGVLLFSDPLGNITALKLIKKHTDINDIVQNNFFHLRGYLF